MTVDPCGCMYDEKYIYGLCPVHKKKFEQAERIAWKVSARTGMTFEQAWTQLWGRIVERWFIRLIEHLKKTIP